MDSSNLVAYLFSCRYFIFRYLFYLPVAVFRNKSQAEPTIRTKRTVIPKAFSELKCPDL